MRATAKRWRHFSNRGRLRRRAQRSEAMEDLETRAARYMFQSHLASFFSLAFRLLYPGVTYQHHWSITVLGEALSRCFKGETQRLIINMPPRSLKSFCASVAFPAWTLARRPEAKILCVAGHRGLADDHHALTRDLMNHPKYRALFPHVRFTETAQKIRLPHGGSRSAFTLTGALTGRGADLIIIDDPQAAHEVGDQAKSAAVRTWYDRNIYQRLDNKEGGVIILVMQRLAYDDLTAHLLDHGGWELLSLPAIATRDEQFPRVFEDRVLRKKGEALNPAREDLAQLRKAMLQMRAQAFMAQYQQKPYPPGEGGERGGAFHIVSQPGATEGECKYSSVFFTTIPEETFLLEQLFDEFSVSFREGVNIENQAHDDLLTIRTFAAFGTRGSIQENGGAFSPIRQSISLNSLFRGILQGFRSDFRPRVAGASAGNSCLGAAYAG